MATVYDFNSGKVISNNIDPDFRDDEVWDLLFFEDPFNAEYDERRCKKMLRRLDKQEQSNKIKEDIINEITKVKWSLKGNDKVVSILG